MSRDGFTTNAIAKPRGGARKKRDLELGDEFQALIAQAGAETQYPRECQAKRLFDKGFGGGSSFRDYLATIPAIPDGLRADNDRFPALVLVDARIAIGRQCKLIGVEFLGGGFTFIDFGSLAPSPSTVYWMRAQDGRKNDGKSVSVCRASFRDDEVGLSVHEGLALHVQNPTGLKGRGMDLSGSIHRHNHSATAYLDWLFGHRPRLSWFNGDREDPRCGPAMRLKTA